MSDILPRCSGREALLMARANAVTALRLLEEDLKVFLSKPTPDRPTERRAHENMERGLRLAIGRERAKLETVNLRLEGK